MILYIFQISRFSKLEFSSILIPPYANTKNHSKKYFKPQLLKSKNLCEKEMLVGEWTVMFKGYDMAKLHFEMMPDVLPNQENHFIDCSVAYEIDVTKP